MFLLYIWDQLGVISYELFKPNETITADLYRLQFMRLSRALKEKRPVYEQRHDKVILQHDDARPYVAQSAKSCSETLKWELLSHSPYSPDIAPFDYHLFRSMAHDLAEQHFHFYEDAKKWFDSWVTLKDVSFFRSRIQMLPERKTIVANDGQYFQ